VCFDFDDVLAVSVWPEPGIGEPIPEGLDMLKHYQDEDYRVFIHTSRQWADQHQIEVWLHDFLGLDRALQVQVICGKPLAGLYIDDRGFRFEREGAAEGGDRERLGETVRKALRHSNLKDEGLIALARLQASAAPVDETDIVDPDIELQLQEWEEMD
jgi:hypothetical protein